MRNFNNSWLAPPLSKGLPLGEQITTMTTKELKALKEKIELHRIAEKVHKDEYEKNKRLADQYELQIRSFLSTK